jgi:hypothetical protein
MRITNCTPPISVWNKEQGWTCEPLPVLEDNQVAITVNVNCGDISQRKLEDLLASAGMNPHYFYLGINDPKVAQGTVLLYLISLCTNQDEVVSYYCKLIGLGIPMSAISIVTPRIQKGLLQLRDNRRSVSSAA